MRERVVMCVCVTEQCARDNVVSCVCEACAASGRRRRTRLQGGAGRGAQQKNKNHAIMREVKERILHMASCSSWFGHVGNVGLIQIHMIDIS